MAKILPYVLKSTLVLPSLGQQITFFLKVLLSILAHSLFKLDLVLTPIPVFMTFFFGSRDADKYCNILMDCQNNTLGFEKYTGVSLTGSADTFCII